MVDMIYICFIHRGLIPITVLKHIEDQCNQPIISFLTSFVGQVLVPYLLLFCALKGFLQESAGSTITISAGKFSK